MASSLSPPAHGSDAPQTDASTREQSITPEEEPPAGDWWDHCPLCGARLHNQGCKYRCPRCRYFMSCSDYD
jgi:acetyl-CoA carboxylase beta subunit